MCYCFTIQDSVAAQSEASDAPQSGSHSANQDEVHYASIAQPRNAGRTAMRASEQVLYASVQQQRDKVVENRQEDDVQYTSVHLSSSHR